MYGSDASRMALADAGDNLDDANFTHENANSAILKLSTLEAFIRETTKNMNNYRKDSPNENINFYDRVFEAELDEIYLKSLEAYESMRFRDVLKICFFELVGIKDDYKLNYGSQGPRKDLITKYIHYQLLLLYPIAPHFCEILYKDCLLPSLEDPSSHPRFISQSSYPQVRILKIYSVCLG